jgi:hypothetical protein
LGYPGLSLRLQPACFGSVLCTIPCYRQPIVRATTAIAVAACTTAATAVTRVAMGSL